MSWAVEEYAEDAVVAYLVANISNAYTVYPAWTNEEIQYPSIVVHAGDSDNVEDTGFNGVRQISMLLAVGTEAKDVGTTSARHVNRTVRDAVITALAQTALQDDINALSPVGVVFSKATVGNIKRDVDDKRVLISVITLDVIAAPQTIA